MNQNIKQLQVIFIIKIISNDDKTIHVILEFIILLIISFINNTIFSISYIFLEFHPSLW